MRSSKPLGERLWYVYFQGSKAREMCFIQTYSEHQVVGGRGGDRIPKKKGVGICLKGRKADYILKG